MATKRSFGTIDLRDGGWFRARYPAPDRKNTRDLTPVTNEFGQTIRFRNRSSADKALANVQADICSGRWVSPDAPAIEAPDSFSVYAARWLAERELAPRTREEYGSLLRLHILPTFGDKALAEITVPMVRTWTARTAAPVSKARSYTVLNTIMKTALADEAITANPCRVAKAGQAKTKLKAYAASPAEIDKLRAELPEKYQLMIDFGCWASMRIGEVCALTRADLDLDSGLVHITKGVIRTKAGLLEADPKTEAGFRSVALPTRVLPRLQEHLDTRVGPGEGALLFPAVQGGYLSHSTVTRVFKPACRRVGLPDTFAFHQLRHSGQTLVAATGATVRQIMNRGGQNSVTAAMRYWHANQADDRRIADGLNDM